ncbi:MAG: helix-turn-helix domain-containing protein [Bacteroidota bacterium]
MGQFTIWDIFWVLGIAQGLFLTITLPTVHEKNTKANSVLAMQLGMASLMLFAKLAIYKAETFWVLQRTILIEPFIFLYGPLGYIYLRRLLHKDSSGYQLPWPHFVLAALYGGYLIYLNILPTEVFQQQYMAGVYWIPFAIAETLALLQNIFYWFKCRGLINRYSYQTKQQLSFNQSTMAFIKVIHGVVLMVLLFWVASFVGSYVFWVSLGWITYNSVWIGIPILIYIVGYYALRQPEIFRLQLPEGDSSKIQKNRLNEQEISTLKKGLEGIMQQEKLYLENELTLVQLAKKIGTTTNNLSWLLNNVYQSNFYDFVNTYRLEAFLDKVKNKEHKHQTLLSLSMEVGFNSKSTFNKAFKSIFKDTPSAYIRKIEV